MENLKGIEDAHIRAYIPVAEKGQRTGYYGLSQFTYDAAHDQYTCPQGQVLRAAYRLEGQQEVQYRADAATCNACPVKSDCTESDRGRHVHRAILRGLSGSRESGIELTWTPPRSRRPEWQVACHWCAGNDDHGDDV